MTDFQIWREELGQEGVEKMMTHPVDHAIIDAIGKDKEDLKTPRNMRVGFLSRQFSAEEMKEPSPPVCKMDVFKKKDTPKLPKVGGNMNQFVGSGDVHYRNLYRGHNGCKFDDQSVGEWVLSVVKPKYYRAAPLMIQFRTSPSRTNCPWCQNGAVSYIDGCAVKFHDSQASAGFGGYSDRYPAYAAADGKVLNNWGRWVQLKHMRVRGNNHHFEATLTDGSTVNCHRGGSIYVRVPRKYTGKIGGLAGTGLGGTKDWHN